MINVSKKKVGLALGAGSARGFAHIGVLQVLEENSIPIDLIVGSSMGSVIGGIYACGTDLHMLSKIVPVLNEKDYFDIVIPRYGGLIKGDKFRSLIRIFTKKYKFSDTKIPFACTAVDLLQGELVVIDQGDIDDAIRASIAIPGLIEPHNWNGKLLIDGGVISRVPCDIARDMGADVVIGVDVGYRGGPPLSPIRRTVDYLYAAFDIIGWEAAKAHDSGADIMIAPDISNINPNSFCDFQMCVENGRKAAERALPQILALL